MKIIDRFVYAHLVREIYFEHDNRKMTLNVSAYDNEENIIGCYVDPAGIPHTISRFSLYGTEMIRVGEDAGII